MALQLTEDNFEAEVLKSDIPVLVDFWAPWCGPCQMMTPIIDKLAGEYEGKVKIGKMNVDESSDTPSKYGIQGIPAFKIFKGGEVVAEFVGARDEGGVKEEIEKVI